jgi:hypothetical protein
LEAVIRFGTRPFGQAFIRAARYLIQDVVVDLNRQKDVIPVVKGTFVACGS